MHPWGLRGAFLAALLCSLAGAYYVPGTFPDSFEYGSRLIGLVNSLRSYETELPYDYYSLPFCEPTEEQKSSAKWDANPGTVLMGLKIEASPYEFKMMVDESGKNSCKDGTAPPLNNKQTKDIVEKIEEMYWVNMVLDNLPVTTFNLTAKDLSYVRAGFPLGFSDKKKYYINNHLLFRILVHKTQKEYTNPKEQEAAAITDAVEGKRKLLGVDAGSEVFVNGMDTIGQQSVRSLTQEFEETIPEDQLKLWKYMVVGFEVVPCSIDGGALNSKDVAESCRNGPHQEVVSDAKIAYTYDVSWQLSTLEWASRWDPYLKMPGGKVHWFSILNSVLVVVVMAVVCAMILIRTIRRDLAHYEELIMDGGPTSADLKEEAGWKLVSGDVFRAPSNTSGLAVRVGSGLQIMCTAIVTLFFAAVGYLSPASRGSLLTGLLALYLLLAITAGFGAVWLWGVVTRTYDGWRGMCWKVALYFPGITMLIFTLVNMFIHHTGTTGAVPIGTYFSLVTLWFIVSTPLTFIGGYFATKVSIIEYPTRTNQIPRHIPAPPLTIHPWMIFFISGLLPFGTLFIELYFVMSSMWMGYFYYLFGYLALIGILTFLVTIEVSVLCTYVQLCAEDYMWWWRSFHRGGSISLYLMLYAVFFLFNTLKNLSGFLSVMVYICYMGILVWGIYLAMGTLGFLSSCAFTYAIFSSVKAD